MVSLGEKVFWTVVALSTIGAAVYGYQRFKLIRPDLYGTPQAVVVEGGALGHGNSWGKSLLPPCGRR